CTKIILMEKGHDIHSGANVSKGIDVYYNKFSVKKETDVVFTDGSIKLLEAKVEGVKFSENNYMIKWGNSVKIKFLIRVKNLKNIPYISLAIYDKEQRGIAEIFPENQS